MNDPFLDPYLDIIGVTFTPERLEANLATFRDILREIEKLRQLDLTDVHPAIVFEPTAPYRREGGK
jgi:putative NADH-flavin reductase